MTMSWISLARRLIGLLLVVARREENFAFLQKVRWSMIRKSTPTTHCRTVLFSARGTFYYSSQLYHECLIVFYWHSQRTRITSWGRITFVRSYFRASRQTWKSFLFPSTDMRGMREVIQLTNQSQYLDICFERFRGLRLMSPGPRSFLY